MKWVTSSSSTQGATMAASSGVSGRRAARSPERKMPASVRSVTARSSWLPEDRLHRKPLQALVHVPVSDRLRHQRQHLVVHLADGLHRQVVVGESHVVRAGGEEAPLDIPLPKQAKSGTTPKCSWAPPSARRNPVTISSKIRSAPLRELSSRTDSRKPERGGSIPTGSMMTAATRPGCSSKIRSRVSMRLYVNVHVSSRTAFGTPMFRVVGPIDQSCQPW